MTSPNDRAVPLHVTVIGSALSSNHMSIYRCISNVYIPVILSISSAWIKIIRWKNAIEDIRCITQLARSTSQLNRYDVKFSTNFFKRRIAKMAEELRVLFSFRSRESARRSRVNYYPLMLQRFEQNPGLCNVLMKVSEAILRELIRCTRGTTSSADTFSFTVSRQSQISSTKISFKWMPFPFYRIS